MAKIFALAVFFLMSAQAWAAPPKWIPLGKPAPGAAAVFYSPSTARIENDRGTSVRAVDVKFVGVNGTEMQQTWKVDKDTCNQRLVDVAFFENGKAIGGQRSLSTHDAGLNSTKIARAACGLNPVVL